MDVSPACNDIASVTKGDQRAGAASTQVGNAAGTGNCNGVVDHFQNPGSVKS